jgi:PHO85 cyclin-6/7
MAEVMSDYSSESSRYSHSRTMIAGPGSAAESQYRSRSRAEPPPSPRTQPTSVPAGTPPPSTAARAILRDAVGDVNSRGPAVTAPPSPPSSSSPNPGSYTNQRVFAGQEAMSHGQSPQDGAADPIDMVEIQSKFEIWHISRASPRKIFYPIEVNLAGGAQQMIRR